MSVSKRWYDAITIAMVIALLSGRCLGQEAKPSIADVERLWKARQDKVAAARFDLETEKTIPKGSVSFLHSLARRGEPSLSENPPRDVVVKGTRRFSLSGSKTRYSLEEQKWDPIGNRLFPKRFVVVCDEQRFKSLDEPTSGQENYPRGIIRNEPRAGPAGNFPLQPIFFTFRGCHPDFFRDLGKFQVAAENVPIAGRPCLELVHAKQGGQREVLYLDQQRDYVPVKFMIVEGGYPMWQVDATYSPDPTIGWLPKSWEYVIRIGRKERRLHETERITVVRYEINPNLDEGEFDIHFPPGTKVFDESPGRHVVYAIGKNGEKGREVAENAGATYEDLLEATTQTHRSLWFWAAVLLVALGGLAVLWFRRRQRNAAVPQ